MKLDDKENQFLLSEVTNCEVHIFYSDRHTAKISPIHRHTVKMSHLSHSNTNSYSSAERRKNISHIS